MFLIYDKKIKFKIILLLLLSLLFYILFKSYSYSKNIESFTVIIKEKYFYHEIDNVFTPMECNKIIQLSRNKLFRSTATGVGVIKERTSWHTWLGDEIPFIASFNKKLHYLINLYSNTKLDYHNTEKLQVVRYLPSQKYNAHYDCCHPDFQSTMDRKIHCLNDLKENGSLRYGTILVYLNDNFTGGETEFPKLGVKIKPKLGKVLIFYSLDPKKKQIDESLHAGLPVKSGIKWICNKWYRLEKFR